MTSCFWSVMPKQLLKGCNKTTTNSPSSWPDSGWIYKGTMEFLRCRHLSRKTSPLEGSSSIHRVFVVMIQTDRRMLTLSDFLLLMLSFVRISRIWLNRSQVKTNTWMMHLPFLHPNACSYIPCELCKSNLLWRVSGVKCRHIYFWRESTVCKF